MTENKLQNMDIAKFRSQTTFNLFMFFEKNMKKKYENYQLGDNFGTSYNIIDDLESLSEQKIAGIKRAFQDKKNGWETDNTEPRADKSKAQWNDAENFLTAIEAKDESKLAELCDIKLNETFVDRVKGKTNNLQIPDNVEEYIINALREQMRRASIFALNKDVSAEILHTLLDEEIKKAFNNNTDLPKH